MKTTAPQISVIVPCWNDRAALEALLGRMSGTADEIIVGDASTGTAAEEVAALCEAVGVRLVSGLTPNRGSQMNAAARLATGDILLFQHADTALQPVHLHALRDAGRDGELVGGGFHRKFDARHPRLRWLEGINRWMNRRGGTIFGDQSLFVRREIFEQLGGFAPIPLMEDVEFSARLRRAGKVVLLDPPLSTSARRSRRRGSWRATLENAALLLLFRGGISPARLHAWYYRHRLGAG